MSEPEPIDTTDSENGDLIVVDPEDYNKTQRLKEIHRARENVLDATNDTPGYASSSEHSNADYRVAQAVSMYVLELEPVIRKAIERGALSEDVAKFSDDYYTGRYDFESIFDFAYRFGHTEDGHPGRALSMQVFRKANELMMRLGLELELDTDDADEWEV